MHIFFPIFFLSGFSLKIHLIILISYCPPALAKVFPPFQSQCYGYGLLSAVDGLVLEGDGAADIATLSEAVMELEDIALAKDLGMAIDECGQQTDDEHINNGNTSFKQT